MSSIGRRTVHQKRWLECVRICTLTYAKKRVNLDDEHWYDHVPELVETIREGKVTTSANRYNHP
jgi:hypothetical protein